MPSTRGSHCNHKRQEKWQQDKQGTIFSLYTELELPPNPPMQPTPLRVEQDRCDFGIPLRSNDILIYQRGAADGQAVGRHPVRTQSHSRHAVDGDAIERQAVLA